MSMKPVMYHYVRPGAPGLPHFPYLALINFERQLDYFQRTYGFVSRPDFEAWVGGGPVPHGVLLTFDDGLRDHAEYVLPVLQERGLFGLFYVPSGPITNNRILDVHKIHLALGRLGGVAVLDWLEQQYPELEPRLNQSNLARYAGQNSDEATKRVKRLFNWQLGSEPRRAALDELFAHAFDGAPPQWSEFYLDEAGVRLLLAAGMGVGAHGHSHAVLSHLTEAAQRHEIGTSCDMIRSLVGDLRWGFCYAYGNADAFDRTAERLVADTGCPFAFAVRDGDIEALVHEVSRYSLPRHNCNAFPDGSVSLAVGQAAQADGQ